jgi:hypothetical protein
MVLNHIIDRDEYLNIEAMSDEMNNELEKADEKLKQALQEVSFLWKNEIINGAEICGVKGEWWQNIISSI